MKKRLTSLLLALILCFGLMSTAALAANGEPFGTYSNGTVTVNIPAGTLTENTHYGTIAVKTADGQTLVGMGSGTSKADGSLSTTIWTGTNANIGDKTHHVFVYKDVDGDLVDSGPITTVVVSVTGVTLNKSTLSLTVGGTETLTATVAPNDATNKSVTWDSSNTNVATVVNGKVTAVAAGTATITVTTAEGGKIATCTVTVRSGGGDGGGGGGTPTYQVSVSSNVENGTVTVSPKNAREGATVTVTATPDEGYELDKLTVTDKDGKAIELTDKGDGTYTFKMPKGKVTVDASFTAKEQPPVDTGCPKDATCPIWPFTDASTTAWYHDGVHYCIENGIMNGYPGNLFGPNDNTTRGQLVTMLHRLEGTPAPSGNQAFDDVSSDDWYADAVLWAAGNGIVNGYGNGNFGPNDPITREQLVTIMWRYAEYKGVDVSASADLSGYTDAGSVSDWAVDAMQWAVGEGVVNGTTTTTLSPQSNASRAQIATIFQRYCEDVVS